MEPIEVAKLAAQAALDKKATRLVLQDLSGLSDVCQVQVICSGSSERQTQAICQGIEDMMREKGGMRPVVIEGKQTGHWILVDYGSTIIHIFLDAIRDFYAIEAVWAKAKKIPIAE